MKKIFLLLVVLSANILATPININTADTQTIAKALTGIGKKKAHAIIEYRQKNGKFKTIEALSKVKGIGKKTIEKNRVNILLANDIEIKQPPIPMEEIEKNDTQDLIK
jgi:competence protein ComEA